MTMTTRHKQNLRESLHFWQTLFVLVVSLSLTSCVELIGSDASFIKYPSWNPCQNGSITFEFKTVRPNALLLYMDGGVDGDYIELRIVGGVVLLNLKLDDGPIDGVQRLEAGYSLNDDMWHKVEVSRIKERTTLTVDKTLQTRTSKGPDHNFDDHRGQYVYIGGVPKEFDGRMSELAVPYVIFEPKLSGSIRNVLFSNCGDAPIRPQMLEFEGMRSSQSDQCETNNPCENDGICLSTDKDVVCDCTSSQYNGKHCETKKSPSDATFFGKEYLSYNLSGRGDAIVSNEDDIIIEFKTRHSEGLLFHTGLSSDYITISIHNGLLYVMVNLGSGRLKKPYKPRMDDNKWHVIQLSRQARETVVKIDSVIMDPETTTGDYTLLSSNIMYVGGQPADTRDRVRGSATTHNFRGCLRQVLYSADSISLDILDLAETKHDFIKVHGGVIFNYCKDVIEPRPVTFLTPEAYITLRSWQTQRNASLSFKFRTNEKNGLLMYNGGSKKKGHFFALEIIGGNLYFIMDMGSGVIKKLVSPVSDGRVHIFKLTHEHRKGTIRLDKTLKHYESIISTDSLQLGGFLYIGGVSSQRVHDLSSHIWSASLGKGYVGCMQDLMVNADKIDLGTAAKNQGARDVGQYCKSPIDQCVASPCLHRGSCVLGWNRYTCDCSRTPYTGSVCQKVAPTFKFDGTQHITIPLPSETETEADDISLRFKTSNPNGLLLTTHSDQSTDSLELSILSGHLQLTLNLGQGGKTLHVGTGLADDRWHSVFIKRRGATVHLWLDNKHVVKGSVRADSGFMGYSTFDLGYMMADTNSVYDQPGGFVGSMQQFIVNSQHYFDMYINKQLPNMKITAIQDTTLHHLHNSLTFTTRSSHAILPLNKLQSTYGKTPPPTSIFFSFRTTEQDGLILYSNDHKDYIAVELTDGYLYFIYSIKNIADRVLINSPRKLNDDKWHEVSLTRPTKPKFVIRVDDHSPTEDKVVDASAPYFDFKNHLYIAGVKKNMYKNLHARVMSRHGFQGCMASLDVNGYVPDLFVAATRTGTIVKGCQGPMVQCKSDSCINNGRCIQHWKSYRCDCDRTSYTGPRCADESISYKFGEEHGIITYTYPYGKRPSTKKDHLALGFTTFATDCVLVRVDSSTTDDYIQLEILDGYIYMSYNMGTAVYPIGEMFARVNDGKHHVVRYERSGPNSTVHLDNLPVQSKNPEGKQLNEFNEQSTVKIGGLQRENGLVNKAFVGVISGLVYNGIRILDLASDNHPRTMKEGDVTLEDDSSSIIKYDKDFDKENWQSTEGIRPTTPRQGVTDDIIFAAAGTGCHGDGDEEECTEGVAGHEDDIITPVITITTPTSKPRSDKPSIPTPEKNAGKPGCIDKGNCDTNTKTNKDKNNKKDKKDRDKDRKNRIKNRKNKNNKNKNNNHNNNKNNKDTKTPDKSGYVVNNKNGKSNVTVPPPNGDTNEAASTKSAELDLGLIIGIAVGVLVALIILIVLLYKFRSRDDGAYKVEETQTFAFVAEGNKVPQSNGNTKTGTGTDSNHTTKSKKRDVKEWYV